MDEWNGSCSIGNNIFDNFVRGQLNIKVERHWLPNLISFAFSRSGNWSHELKLSNTDKCWVVKNQMIRECKYKYIKMRLRAFGGVYSCVRNLSATLNLSRYPCCYLYLRHSIVSSKKEGKEKASFWFLCCLVKFPWLWRHKLAT